MEDNAANKLPDSMLIVEAVKMLRSRLHTRGLAISISGIDGSGKTTLAREVVQALKAARVPVRYLHVHRWYLNGMMTPIRLFYNRYFGYEILVLDRSIYDNIAVISIRRYCPRWLSRMALAVVLALYPKFDYRFYLVVAFDEALLRRPDTGRTRFMALVSAYDEITFRARYLRLQSDARLFSTVLRKITDGP